MTLTEFFVRAPGRIELPVTNLGKNVGRAGFLFLEEGKIRHSVLEIF